VNATDVTPPSKSDWAVIYIVYIEIFAMHPSPAPTMISPLGNNPIQATPNEKSFFTGANRL